MKKCIILIALISFAGSTSAFAVTGSAFTSGAATNKGVGVYGQRSDTGSEALIGKLSNNVYANFFFDKNSYAVNTKHDSGTKEYGSSSGDTKLFYKDYTTPGAPESPGVSDSSAYTSWQSL